MSTRPSSGELFGRLEERGVLEDLVRRAGEGVSGVAIVEGGPGVGKTILLEHAAALAAAGFAVVRTRGIETESEIPFAGLSEVLRALVASIDELPLPQAIAVEAALALGPPVPTARLALGVAVLTLLGSRAERQPVLVLIDDIHWMDAASVEALLFAARRLHAERVAVVIATRPAAPSGLDVPAFRRLPLQGLAQEHLMAMVVERLGVRIHEDAARALSSVTEGNPLAVLEIARHLPAESLTGARPLPAQLPLTEAVERLHSASIEALGSSAKAALGVAAVDGTERLDVVASALSALGLTIADLRQAEEAGVVSLDAGSVRFAHPLLRATARHRLSTADRRAAHAAVAQAVELSPAARAWHTAHATTGLDERVAAALEAVASEAQVLGGVVSAAPALERAAELTAAGPERARRLTAAAGAVIAGGQLERVEPLLDEVMECDPDPLLRSDAQRLRGRLLAFTSSAAESTALLRAEAERVAPFDRERAALMVVDAGVPAVPMLDLADALQAGRRGFELAPPGSTARAVAAAHLANALLLVGSTDEGTALLLSSPPAPRDVSLHPSDATAYHCLERHAEALRILDDGIARARTEAAVLSLPLDLALRSWVLYDTGSWSSSYAAAAESASLATATGQIPIRGFALINLARLDAAQGRDEACREKAEEARQLAPLAGAIARLHAESDLALLALGRQRWDEAADLLAPVIRQFRRAGCREPTVVIHGADFVEALVRCGRRAEAQDELALFEADAQQARRQWALAAALRCRMLLGSPNEAPELFCSAASSHESSGRPFEAARTDLAYGEKVVESDPHGARGPLARATAAFDRLGAVPWAERARSLLGRCGGPTSPAPVPLATALTPQELQVSIAVANGATNKEVATALFLSRKTVEFHLGNVYRKLGVTSRTQLARLVLLDEVRSGPGGPPATTPADGSAPPAAHGSRATSGRILPA